MFSISLMLLIFSNFRYITKYQYSDLIQLLVGNVLNPSRSRLLENPLKLFTASVRNLTLIDVIRHLSIICQCVVRCALPTTTSKALVYDFARGSSRDVYMYTICSRYRVS